VRYVFVTIVVTVAIELLVGSLNDVAIIFAAGMHQSMQVGSMPRNFEDFGTKSLASFMNLSRIQKRVALRIQPYLQEPSELPLVNSSTRLLWSHPRLLLRYLGVK